MIIQFGKKNCKSSLPATTDKGFAWTGRPQWECPRISQLRYLKTSVASVPPGAFWPTWMLTNSVWVAGTHYVHIPWYSNSNVKYERMLGFPFPAFSSSCKSCHTSRVAFEWPREPRKGNWSFVSKQFAAVWCVSACDAIIPLNKHNNGTTTSI